jgi:hypothetical protein
MATDTDSERASAEAPEPRVAGAVAPAPRKVRWSAETTKRVAALLVVVLVVAGGWFFFHGGGGTDCSDGGTSHDIAGLTTLRDTKACYALNYPSAWTEVGAGAAQNSGSHVFRINGRDAFTIRTYRFEGEPAKDPEAMRAVTDSILSTPGAKLSVFDVNNVKVGGLPALRYLYYYQDGKQRGIHAHYFIFDGHLVHNLVFQVVPVEKFESYAAQFDHVLASFKPLTP